jgi:DNA modification methylase
MFENLRMTLEYWPIEKLLPYARNPRKNDHAVEKGANWIKEFGFRVPILAKSTGEISDGHLRLKCAQKLKMKEVPVLLTDDMNDVQIRAFRLSVNQFAALADWDIPVLKDELQELDKLQYDIESLGFDDIKIDNLEPNNGLTDPDDIPKIKENIFDVKRGDIWILGNHRLMCGDSTSEIDVMQLMNGHKADCVFTDPPYGMDLDTDYTKMPVSPTGAKPLKYKKIIGDDKEFDPNLILNLFEECDEIFLFGADYYAKNLPIGSWFVWDKRVTENFDRMIGSAFELCWSKRKHKREIARFNNTLYSGEADAKNKVHPTQKPIKLIEWFFERFKGQAVVDLFLGSGSTLIACEKTGRTCYGCELDEHYCSVIIKRWQDFSGKKAIKEV